ncbi:MAG TPA: hypothetical protein VGR37_09375 [Longimicrobiaceae bacterium]|nr:hypothetical protein [Longimicrobiaceae bacterium]
MDARYPSRVPGLATGMSGYIGGGVISRGGVGPARMAVRGARDAM